jgi:hypothetical protein
MQQLDATIEELYFLCGSCRDIISKGTKLVDSEFCTGGCEDRT